METLKIIVYVAISSAIFGYAFYGLVKIYSFYEEKEDVYLEFDDEEELNQL